MSQASARWEGVLVFGLFLALTLASTWPLASDLDGQLLMAQGRFDGFGTVWLGEHFHRALTSDATLFAGMEMNHPNGIDLRLADSFLYGFVYVPLRMVLSPAAAFNVFALGSIAATATSGWWLARRALGTALLPALVCGFIVAFNAPMFNYRVEGEAYLLGGFLLPLLAGHLWLAGKGSWRNGAYAGAVFGLLAWSSGYYAIDGVFLAAALVVAAIAAGDRKGIAAPALAFVVVALLLVGPLAHMVSAGLEGALEARFRADEDPLLNVSADSVSLSSMLAVLPNTAHLRQGRLSYIGMAPLIVAGAALITIGWRKSLPWLSIAGAGVVLSLGPFLRLTDLVTADVELPYAWLVEWSRTLLAYRMPIRFLSVAAVGLGALAALLMDQLRREGLGWGWRGAISACIVFDGLIMTGFAVDETVTPVEIPEAYTRLTRRGAVFDLWGRDTLMLRYAGLSAWYQAHHGQPVLADFTRVGDDQTVIGERLALAILAEDDEAATEALEVLYGLGVSDVVLHSESFRREDSATIRAALKRLATAIPGAGDDSTQVYAIPSRYEGMDQDAASARVHAWAEEAS